MASSAICALNTQCVNIGGSFECVCVDGYELIDEECEREGIVLSRKVQAVIYFTLV